ncbi:hypothetical protein MAELSTROM_3 [Pseudoalteromonas phage Maelstrom]|uniref:hypothetical protein n=1 Tax=Pseudoalteromonas phage Maelstrom TaxID=2065202 RepID=UPI000CA289EE|nr:hypothetical protein PP584_gp03 [Pseudoalteromonas phage Maelstrom]AUG84923.1 hypothetical protein MAELSTROM_3 [Pseudoalteromonas phage Maelstrom]
MNEEQKEFLAELKQSRVKLCKRAACSLGVAWSDLEQASKRIAKLEDKLREVSLLRDCASWGEAIDYLTDYTDEIKQLLGDE